MLKLIFILSFSTLIQAEIFYTDTPSEKNKIEIIHVNGLHINKVCNLDQSKCISFIFSQIKNKKVIQKKSTPYIGNPASTNCTELEGKSNIYYDIKNNQYDFCEFSNGIIIDSWDLFNRFK